MLFFTLTVVFVIISQIFWIFRLKMICILPFHQYIKMTYQNEMVLMFVQIYLNEQDKSIFNFRFVRLYDVDVPKEKWLNYLQTVETLIRCHVL